MMVSAHPARAVQSAVRDGTGVTTIILFPRVAGVPVA
jgi:hypothetical protein